jgi:2,4-dienoyl-CoA reductase-like NADH-dependent reductase (Old Yellow Enzyme family)
MNLSEADLGEVLSERELENLKMGYRETVNDVHLEYIHELPQTLPSIFAAAVRRAEIAGFDGVELHYAHAYTMASFLSALNSRGDGYGGSREDRARLPLVVYDKVRAALQAPFVVGCRFLSEDCIEGGNTVADAAYFATEFAAAGMDFLSLSRGGKFEDAKQPRGGSAAYPYTGPSGYECMPQCLSDAFGPFGRNVEPTARIRAVLRDHGHSTPVVVACGIHDF